MLAHLSWGRCRCSTESRTGSAQPALPVLLQAGVQSITGLFVTVQET